MSIPLKRFVLVAIHHTERSIGSRKEPFLVKGYWSDEQTFPARSKPGGPATRTIEIILWARFPSITLEILWKKKQSNLQLNFLN